MFGDRLKNYKEFHCYVNKVDGFTVTLTKLTVDPFQIVRLHKMIISLYIFVVLVTGPMLLPKNVMWMNWSSKKHGNSQSKFL